MRRSTLSILFLAVACMVCGCDTTDPNRPKVYETSVTVTLDGEPVSEATVTLQSPDSSNTNSSYGQTDENGVCLLTTFDANDGVIPGEYQVRLRKVETITEPNPTEYDPDGYTVIEERIIIPEKYGSITAGLTLTVTPEGPNEFTFDLK